MYANPTFFFKKNSIKKKTFFDIGANRLRATKAGSTRELFLLYTRAF